MNEEFLLMRNPMFRCVSRFRCPESKNRTNREWISDSDKEMPFKWPETCLQSILLSNIGQYTQKAISRVRSALKCVFRIVRQIPDKTVRKYTQPASWSRTQAEVTSMFDDDDNNLSPNVDDKLNDDRPIACWYSCSREDKIQDKTMYRQRWLANAI